MSIQFNSIQLDSQDNQGMSVIAILHRLTHHWISQWRVAGSTWVFPTPIDTQIWKLAYRTEHLFLHDGDCKRNGYLCLQPSIQVSYKCSRWFLAIRIYAPCFQYLRSIHTQIWCVPWVILTLLTFKLFDPLSKHSLLLAVISPWNEFSDFSHENDLQNDYSNLSEVPSGSIEFNPIPYNRCSFEKFSQTNILSSITVLYYRFIPITLPCQFRKKRKRVIQILPTTFSVINLATLRETVSWSNWAWVGRP